MYELCSRKHPHKAPQILTDEEFEAFRQKPQSRAFVFTHFESVKQLIPTPKIIKPVIEVKKFAPIIEEPEPRKVTKAKSK